jgi:hypothetical protein
MTITPDQADRLKKNATSGPWTAYREYPEYFMQVYSDKDKSGITDNGVVEDADAALIAAAPDLAQTIAGMEWEWGVLRPWGETSWFQKEEHAREWQKELGTPLVRRLVGPVEEAE